VTATAPSGDGGQGALPERGARDRDAAGRPRNARPRDALGRPLARTAAGEPTLDESLRLAPAEALRLAQHLIDSGRPFHAHEVLEGVWKTAPEAERGLWKGLAQLAVGLTHVRRGNARGAVALLRRGAEAVGQFAGRTTVAIDATSIRRAALALADRVEQAGTDAVPALELTLKLRPPDG
jgi:uncharacterized protein